MLMQEEENSISVQWIRELNKGRIGDKFYILCTINGVRLERLKEKKNRKKGKQTQVSGILYTILSK